MKRQAQTRIKPAGKFRMPRNTRFPAAMPHAAKLGIDTRDPEAVSSPALTAWYVAQFCAMNCLRA